MKIKPNYLLKEVADNYIVVPVGEESLNFNAIITLNDTGAFLFNKMASDITLEQLVESMTNEYDVSPDIATDDVKAFISKLDSAHIIEK